jgi:hypothetical protein
MTPARPLIDVLYEGDRRALTSRANLGHHVPQALDPQGAIVVAIRLPTTTVEAVDAIATANGVTRSEVLRSLIDFGLKRV